MRIMGKIADSFKMVTTIVTLLGYGMEKNNNEDDGVNYWVIDTKGENIGAVFRYNDFFTNKPDVYGITIKNDIYDVVSTKYAVCWDAFYFVEVKDGKECGIDFTFSNGTLDINLYIPEEIGRESLSLSLNGKSFEIKYENQSVKYDGETYVIEYVNANGEEIVRTIREVDCSIQIEDTVDGFSRKPIFVEETTLEEYIRSDAMGITLLSQYDCIYSRFPFTKTLEELLGEDLIESSGLSLLFEAVDKEKEVSVEEKLKKLVG